MYTLQPLSYDYSMLEPFIDAATMEIHHSKHHQAYVNNFNKALENNPELQNRTPEDLISNLNTLGIDETTKTAIRNHGGGVINHNFFWSIMDPNNQPNAKLTEESIAIFGSVEELKKQCSETALKHFGSGWTWLVREASGALKIYSTSNQDSPLTLGHEPLLTIDVWEHAYYLKYQNRRVEYIENWWKTVKLI